MSASQRAALLAAALLCAHAPATVAAAQAGPAKAAQPAAMRTRLLPSLTGYEVETYLKRNDVIFVPVGPTEVHGAMPLDVEYTIPLAYSVKLAEKADGLVLPYLAYFYPGSTTVSRGTVHMSPSEGLAYLKPLTRSLIRQGFRRIVFVTAHGPSGDTMQPLVREIFDETHVPVVWLESSTLGRRSGAAGAPPSRGEFSRLAYGAYLSLGRLEDIPVGLAEPRRPVAEDGSTQRLMRMLGGGSSKVGGFYGDPSQHGGWVDAITPAQRDQYAREGLATLEANVAAFDVAGMLQALRDHATFVGRLERQYGDLLPPGPTLPDVKPRSAGK